MRLNTLYLVGALTVLAVPLSAAAQPGQPYPQTGAGAEQAAASVEQAAPAADACPPNWVWEPAGYMSYGKWRSAHCAPRNAVAP